MEKGKKEYVDVVLVNDAIELLNVNDKVSKYNFKIDIEKIVAPVKKGNVIGKVQILNEDNKIINEVDITVKEDVKKANIWDLFLRNLRYNLVWK